MRFSILAFLGLAAFGLTQAKQLTEHEAAGSPPVVGGDPSTWSPTGRTNGPWGSPTATTVGGNPSTWGPPNRLPGSDPTAWGPNNRPANVGGDPSTWSPTGRPSNLGGNQNTFGAGSTTGKRRRRRRRSNRNRRNRNAPQDNSEWENY